MRHLTNPILLRAAIVLCASTIGFLLVLIFMRLLRKRIAEDADLAPATSPELETFPLEMYNTVIQQLKQQKHELQVQSKTEQRRARTTETLSQAVLSNLPCGILVIGVNGLVKTANPAAKEILGFASPAGMSAADIFRHATVKSGKPVAAGVYADGTEAEMIDPSVRVSDEVDAVLREGSGRRQVEAEYKSPGGERRFLAVTISPIPAEDGTAMGVACAISDQSKLEDMRHEQQLCDELSAEMALQLRTSLATISGYAQQLAGTRDPSLAKQLAADVAHEAAALDRNVGGFLAGKISAHGASAGSTE